MGIFDALFGRTKMKPASREALFDILDAQVTMTTQHNIQSAGRAGLCLNPVASSFFETLDRDVRDLLKISAKETGTVVDVQDDSYGYRWVILQDPEFEDLVTTIHMVSDMTVEQGFGDRMLVAAFKFRAGSGDIYWIYSYRRGAFYPFVPIPGKQARDNEEELRLSSILERDMKMEKQLDQWYPLWGMPV